MKSVKEPKSLNKRLLAFLIFCWVVPIAVFFAFTTISYREGIIEKVENLMEDELRNISSVVSIRIGEAVKLCQKTSYERTCEGAWRRYEAGIYDRTEYMQIVNTSLRGKFYLDGRFDLYAYYSRGAHVPDRYTSRIGASYTEYVDTIQPYIDEIMEDNSSDPYVKILEGRLFIVRNLFTISDHKWFGTMVVELNKERIFQDVPREYLQDLIFCIGDEESMIDFTNSAPKSEKKQIVKNLFQKYDNQIKDTMKKEYNVGYNGYFYQQKYDNYHSGMLLFAERSKIYSSLYDLYIMVLIMLLLFCPVIWFGMYFLHKEIQVPIESLIKMSRKMEDGEIGVIEETEVMPNQEFNYLKESFNSMSLQVKYLFDYAYDEKLARKDAQIQALQAQINPHFLNNTLEMMNWQARMSGDAIVSKMIESLGTVLDYRMNRSNINEIHLAEELKCNDAYFYIMSMRFGQRLQIEREIDQELLYIMVPPLILQPIVENAIVHGVETMKNGIIKLKVFHDEVNVYLQVTNSGKEMTKKDKERIQAILTGDNANIPKVPGRHTSIGIRNVNKRIQLVYGEKYGLTIGQNEDLITISTITIPYKGRNTEDLVNERSKAEDEFKNMARLNK